MNISTMTCVDNQAVATGVIRGNSDKLMVLIRLMLYLECKTYELMVVTSMVQNTPKRNEGVANVMTTPYRNLLLVKHHILPHAEVQFLIALV